MDDTPRADYPPQVDWRSIKCIDVNWYIVPGISRRAAMVLSSLSTPEHNGTPGEMQELTLGKLAARGEITWRWPGVGPVAVEGIKLTIDHAAAGFNLKKSMDKYPYGGEPYTPRPVKRPEE